MDNQQATQVELAWLAGMLEGDGSLNLRLAWTGKNQKRRYVQTPIEFANTDKEIIEQCVNICKKLDVNLYVGHTERKAPQHQRKIVYHAKSHTMLGAQKILPSVIPFMVGEKRLRARYMLCFCSLRKLQLAAEKSLGRDLPYDDEQINHVVACQQLVSPWKSPESIRLELAENRR